jgi:lipopolysaccharide/colanic/teichoic acid biosynthesis glycosyltransferase
MNLKKKNKMENLKERWQAKTPKFWKKVQRIGLVAGALGAALVAVPVALPVAIITGAGYLIAAGTVTAALSQLTVEDQNK